VWRRISCSYRIDSFFFGFFFYIATPKIVRACIYAVNDNVRRMFGPPLYMVVADDDDDIIRRKKKKRREVDSFTPASFLGWQSRSFSHAFHLSALYIPGWFWCSLSNPYLSIPYAALDGNRSHAAMSVSRAAAAVLFFLSRHPHPGPRPATAKQQQQAVLDVVHARQT
jgi:hypothetical protein